MRKPISPRIHRLAALFPHEESARKILTYQVALCRAGLLSAIALPTFYPLSFEKTPIAETRLRESAKKLRATIGESLTIEAPYIVSSYTETLPFPAIVARGGPSQPDLAKQLTRIALSETEDLMKNMPYNWLIALIPPLDGWRESANKVLSVAREYSPFPLSFRNAYLANLVVKITKELVAVHWERGLQLWLPSRRGK